MTAPRRRASGLYVPLQGNYMFDPAVQAVGNAGELAFVRSLAWSKIIDRDGLLMDTHMAPVKRGIRSWPDVVAALVEHNLWVWDPTSHAHRIRNWTHHNGTKVERDLVLEQEAARKRESRVRRTQTTKTRVSERTSGLAHEVEKSREVSDRTPSGPVRSETRTAAPRGTGGATQPPAADHEREVVGSEPDPEPIPAESAKELIWNTLKSSSKSTGRPSSLRRSEWLPKSEPSKHQQNLSRFDELLGGGDSDE